MRVKVHYDHDAEEFIEVSESPNSCEWHDRPGECTQECARIAREMCGDANFDPYYVYDPTRCREPAPTPTYDVEYNEEERRVVSKTIHPYMCHCNKCKEWYKHLDDIDNYLSTLNEEGSE